MPEIKTLRHLVKLQRFARKFNDALELAQAGWNSNISRRQHIIRTIYFITIALKIQAFIFPITIFNIILIYGKMDGEPKGQMS